MTDLLRLTQANAFTHFAFLPRVAHAVIITVTVYRIISETFLI